MLVSFEWLVCEAVIQHETLFDDRHRQDDREEIPSPLVIGEVVEEEKATAEESARDAGNARSTQAVSEKSLIEQSHDLVLQLEDVICRDLERAGKEKGQLETRHISIPLDRVDALPGHADCFGELLLRPAASIAKLFDAVPDGHDKFTLHLVRRDVKLSCHVRSEFCGPCEWIVGPDRKAQRARRTKSNLGFAAAMLMGFERFRPVQLFTVQPACEVAAQ